MTEAVLDDSVVLRWFGGRGEDHELEALAIRAAYVEGGLLVLAPALLTLELLNAAARRWRWPTPQVVELATQLDRVGFECGSQTRSASRGGPGPASPHTTRRMLPWRSRPVLPCGPTMMASSRLRPRSLARS